MKVIFVAYAITSNIKTVGGARSMQQPTVPSGIRYGRGTTSTTKSEFRKIWKDQINFNDFNTYHAGD